MGVVTKTCVDKRPINIQDRPKDLTVKNIYKFIDPF